MSSNELFSEDSKDLSRTWLFQIDFVISKQEVIVDRSLQRSKSKFARYLRYLKMDYINERTVNVSGSKDSIMKKRKECTDQMIDNHVLPIASRSHRDYLG